MRFCPSWRLSCFIPSVQPLLWGAHIYVGSLGLNDYTAFKSRWRGWWFFHLVVASLDLDGKMQCLQLMLWTDSPLVASTRPSFLSGAQPWDSAHSSLVHLAVHGMQGLHAVSWSRRWGKCISHGFHLPYPHLAHRAAWYDTPTTWCVVKVHCAQISEHGCRKELCWQGAIFLLTKIQALFALDCWLSTSSVFSVWSELSVSLGFIHWQTEVYIWVCILIVSVGKIKEWE